LRGNWIFFDYLFSKTAAVNPIIKCLTSMGLTKYGEVKLTNTYLVTVGFNYELGLLLMLYSGRKVERQLDDLAYVISHMFKAPVPRLVELDRKLLTELASYLESSFRWELKGWISKEGRNIELDLVQKNRDEYLDKLRRGEWKSLIFQNKYSKIKLTIGARRKNIDVSIRKKYYKPGPKRDLRPTFDELARGLVINKVSEIVPSSSDEAGILRAYTERRGIISTIKFEMEKFGREAFDVSYDFVGYDVKSGEYLIEVKAFKDSVYKAIQLTKNEYETMNREENYRIYVVEDAWDNIPKINMIDNPASLLFVKRNKDVLETKIALEEYFECNENIWRAHVINSDFIKLFKE